MYSDLTATERRDLEDELAACASMYKHVLFEQRLAVLRLMEDAKEEEEPTLSDRLLAAAAQVALTAALGPVGAYVGDAIASEGAQLATRLLAVAVVDGAKKVVESGVDAAYEQAQGSAGDRDAKTFAFFRAQHDLLTEAGVATELEFIREGKETIRMQPDPMAEATRTLKGLQRSEDHAYTVQETKTLSEWITLKAKSEYGTTTEDGVADIGEADLDDSSEVGILGVEIEQVESPYDPGNPLFVVRAMSSDGLHARLKARLAGKKLGSLDVPCSIHATVHGYGGSGVASTGELALGRSENASWTWNQSDDNGTRFLKMYGAGRTIHDPKETDALSDALARKGMARLWASIEVLPVHNLE